MYDQFLLFGDSITQQVFEQDPARNPDGGRSFAMGAALADRYIRKLDVINRGFSGYNTRQALKVIDQVIPPPSKAKLKILAIWFGANDSRLPDSVGTPQNVELSEYKENLRQIITHPSVRAHEDVHIMVLNTPPVEETLQANLDRLRFPGMEGVRRTAQVNKAYAQAAREVVDSILAQNLYDNRLCMLDVHAILMRYAKNDETGVSLPGSSILGLDEGLASVTTDGLHLNSKGYEAVYNALIETMDDVWRDLRPARIPFVHPFWDDVQAWL